MKKKTAKRLAMIQIKALASDEKDIAYFFEDYEFPLVNGADHPDLVHLGEGAAMIYKDDLK